MGFTPSWVRCFLEGLAAAWDTRRVPCSSKASIREFGALFFRQGRLRLLVICVFAGMGDANDNFEIADVVQKLVVEQAMVWPRSRVYYNAVVSTNR